jgi:hypothetical protein
MICAQRETLIDFAVFLYVFIYSEAMCGDVNGEKKAEREKFSLRPTGLNLITL